MAKNKSKKPKMKKKRKVGAKDKVKRGERSDSSTKLPSTDASVLSANDSSSGEEERKNTRRLVAAQNRKKKKSGGFQSMGLSHTVHKGVVRKGYKVPTPIQRKTMPLIMEGKDVVAMARTGSGKTAAFLVPMFEKLQTHSAKAGARALVLSPTRELAVQTLKFTKELGKFTGLRAAVVLGGDKMEDQFAALHESPDIIVATPGRFMHVVMEMDLKLKSVQYVVFDEADRLFEMGFQEQLTEILHRLPESRQTLLFSATLPKLLVDFAKAGLHDPTLVRLDVETKLSEQLQMSFLQCRADDKLAVLLHLLKNVLPQNEQTFVFAATKHHVEFLHMILQKAEISSTYIYSALDPTARKINIAKFQNGKAKVMVVTDLAARGIDIPLLDNVINYNFPAKPKLFVHRVGRVARAGRTGTAISLIGPDELAYVLDLHVFLGKALKTKPVGTAGGVEDGVFGLVPQSVIDDMSELQQAWIQQSTDLTNMVRVCQNAFTQYIKSRPAPANESIKRAKKMTKSSSQLQIHPIFGEAMDQGELERTNLLNALKSYKTNSTIFEINSTAKTNAFGIMKQKRGFHQGIIQSQHRKQEDVAMATEDSVPVSRQPKANDEDLSSAFSHVIGKKRQTVVKDEENYLNYRPADYQSEQGYKLGTSFDKEASGAVLDLMGDDENMSQQRKGQMRWDRKRKKFVRENNDDPKKKKIRTESGAWVPASYKSNVYKEWVQKNKMDTGHDDADDDDKPKKSSGKQGRFSVVGHKHKRWHTKGSEGDKGSRDRKNKFKSRTSERQQPEQIMKKRTLKARKEAFQKQRENMRAKRKGNVHKKGR